MKIKTNKKQLTKQRKHAHKKKLVLESISEIMNWYIPTDSFNAPRRQAAGAHESLL